MNTIRLAQLAFGLGPSVLGATGNRIGVWTQGCSLPKCAGCTSAHTWSAKAGRTIEVNTLLKIARAQPHPPTGLTISGGEPSDQAAAVEALIEGFREAFPSAEVVLYTGLRWPVFVARHPVLAALPDVIISGPYVRTLAATVLAGSSNQEVRLLTPLAKRLYLDWDQWPKHRMQVGHGGEKQVITIGIPQSNLMERAARQTGTPGISWDQTRQRPNLEAGPVPKNPSAEIPARSPETTGMDSTRLDTVKAKSATGEPVQHREPGTVQTRQMCDHSNDPEDKL